MKTIPTLLIALALLLAAVAPAQAAPATYSGFPTFTIVSVKADESVTIKTANLPAGDKFDVLMGKMGTRAVGGVKVASFDSGAGGAQTLTFTIPASLKGLFQVAIRFQSPTSGFFAYNWFFNNTTGSGTGGGTTPPGGYSGFPTFSIVSVEKDKTVTIKTANLPASDKFDVLMGKMGTRAVNGVKVGTFDSGAGGAQTLTFNVPASLAGLAQIAIRFQSPTSGYFAYNWFWNNTAGGSTGGGTTPPSGYSGFPTFSISGVTRNTTVTVKTANLPPNDTFDVLMGAMWTKGVNGVKVGSFNSGAGGVQTLTFNIPASLAGSERIAIRFQSPTSGYFAYNWFWNFDA